MATAPKRSRSWASSTRRWPSAAAPERSRSRSWASSSTANAPTREKSGLLLCSTYNFDLPPLSSQSSRRHRSRGETQPARHTQGYRPRKKREWNAGATKWFVRPSERRRCSLSIVAIRQGSRSRRTNAKVMPIPST